MTTLAPLAIRTSVPATFGSPIIVMTPPPAVLIVTLSPLPSPATTLPLSVDEPVTFNVLLNVAAPFAVIEPVIDVLPVAGLTMKFDPPTVRLAPATSRPLLASTFPPNVTCPPVCVTAPVAVVAPVMLVAPTIVVAPVMFVVPDSAIVPVPAALIEAPKFVASPSSNRTVELPALVVKRRSLLPMFTKRLPVIVDAVLFTAPRRTFALPASLYVRPSSAPTSPVIGKRETLFAAPIISTSAPATFGKPFMLRTPPPAVLIATLSPLPSPATTLPLSVALPATASVLLSVAAPLAESVPVIDVLPLAGLTVKLAPPTVRLAPVTSSPLFASTLPPNDT